MGQDFLDILYIIPDRLNIEKLIYLSFQNRFKLPDKFVILQTGRKFDII